MEVNRCCNGDQDYQECKKRHAEKRNWHPEEMSKCQRRGLLWVYDERFKSLGKRLYYVMSGRDADVLLRFLWTIVRWDPSAISWSYVIPRYLKHRLLGSLKIRLRFVCCFHNMFCFRRVLLTFLVRALFIFMLWESFTETSRQETFC